MNTPESDIEYQVQARRGDLPWGNYHEPEAFLIDAKRFVKFEKTHRPDLPFRILKVTTTKEVIE